MKVLHLPTEVGGNAHGLACGERALGMQSEHIVAFGGAFAFPAQRIIYQGPSRNRQEYWCRRLRLVGEFLQLRNKYDIYHFNFGTTLLDPHGLGNLADLPFYGKGRIAVTYNGCDARQKYPTLEREDVSACHQADCYGGICNDGLRDAHRRRRIAKVDRYADIIFALNPDLFWTLPERTCFLPYTIANWQAISPSTHPKRDKAIRIVHAPSNRACKGSATILLVMDKLIQEYGDRVEWTLVENMSNSEALKAYAQADLCIDQLLIGWYGAVAVESMKMGVPVMSFIRESDLRFIPPAMAEDLQHCFFNVSEETLETRLREVIENPGLLDEAAYNALAYVHAWHDPLKVAATVREAYEKALAGPPRSQTASREFGQARAGYIAGAKR